MFRFSSLNSKSRKSWLTGTREERRQPIRHSRRTEKLVFATSSRTWQRAKKWGSGSKYQGELEY